MSFLFKDRDGQTPLPYELTKGLRNDYITTMGELDQLEEANIALGLSWLEGQSANPNSYKFWLISHKKMFEDVWDWAGKVRGNELENDDFCRVGQLWNRINQTKTEIDGWIEYSSYPNREFLARVHEQLVGLHPFPNGNGRWSRILTEYYSKFHSFEKPVWGDEFSNNPVIRRRKYIESLIKACREGDYSDLISFMFNSA